MWPVSFSCSFSLRLFMYSLICSKLHPGREIDGFSNCVGGHEAVGEAQQVLVLSHQIILCYGQDKLESLRKK